MRFPVAFLCLLLLPPLFLPAQATRPDQPEVAPSSRRGGVGDVLLSLVVPGAGEWRLGNRRAARIFFGSEIVAWASYLSTRGYINVLQNDLKAFAANRAGVNSAGKDDQYWIDIGQAMSIYDYNRQRLLDRDLNGVYEENAGFDWQWQSESDRRDYRSRRLSRLDWKRTSTFMLGGIVLNHLVSAVDVIRLVRRNRAADSAAKQGLRSSNLHFALLPRPEGDLMQVNFTLRF